MTQTVSLGAQDFAYIRENDCFLVDKTDFIREWWENKDAVTLITRPRRFGKTLNLSMLECFFSIVYQNRSDLFEGLSIWETREYRDLQGTYPVIYMSFANIKGTTFQSVREGIIQSLVRLYGKYAYLRDESFMSSQDLEFFDSVRLEMSDTTAALAISSLSDYLSRYYKKKVLIFLDEYDTPLQEAYVNGFWKDLVEFMRGLFNASFKSNPFLERGLLTGITRVSKESIFSDLNNLTVITTTSEKYSTQFGFTQEEVCRALETYGLESQKEKVKYWYDGFSFGIQKDIYNPWSITCFLEEKKFKPYWVNTSSNEMITSLIQRGNAETKTIMEELLEGRELITEIDEEIIFEQLSKKKNAIWSLLLASGYLKVSNVEVDEHTDRFVYHLSITNREVRMMFENMIKDWFSNEDVPYNDFVRALLRDDVKEMNHYMNAISMATFSFFDVGSSSNSQTRPDRPERFYHGFVLGLIVELAGRYRISSNRESGYGRYDVMLEPIHNNDLAFILEFKVFEQGEQTLEDTVSAAKKQIQDKQYVCELKANGINPERIRCYGFAFHGKKVLIG
ncbi:AAA family ATPase [Blautia sp. MSJ-19]|uniref:AAA family ATPase n=1 Tax=Blautia sp. MSJ-19 TaxID=2841517 RepID=UPI001C0E9C6F|nr:AAA family ATPase [Blautia sp. MSJ-19]MBU5480282.1 ATP-binding protein [Blautia sp. MSJ-19]